MTKWEADLQDFSVRMPDGEWQVIQEDNAGICLRYGLQSIVIYPKQSGKWLLATFLHETLHALCPNLSEKATHEMDKVLSTVLWRAGYRRRSESTRRKRRSKKK